MSELAKNLEKLAYRLDCMALRVVQSVNDALRAVSSGDIFAGEMVEEEDVAIDQEEVAIERECIRLLALYQPTAVDLRRICCIIKINNDLERIADIAAHLGRRVRHLGATNTTAEDFAAYPALAELTRQVLNVTLRTLNAADSKLPRQVIALDRRLHSSYKAFVRDVLDDARIHGNVDEALTLTLLGRSLERIGDHCTNIAEDVYFLLTGEIVRHSDMLKIAATDES